MIDMEKAFFNPTVQLRCNKCNVKTPHALLDFSEEPKEGREALTLNYECQNCSEKKRVFVFVTYRVT
jgi:hypothetical protein